MVRAIAWLINIVIFVSKLEKVILMMIILMMIILMMIILMMIPTINLKDK